MKRETDKTKKERNGRRSETSRWNPFVRGLVNFQGTVCKAEGRARLFCNQIKGFGNVSFIEKNCVSKSQAKFQRVRQSSEAK